jgi:hypothetical protein
MARHQRTAIALVAVAALVLATPWPAGGVERAFSATAYPFWQRTATAATNVLPFAAFDVFLAVAIAGLLATAIGAWRTTVGGRLRRTGAALLGAASVVAVVYLWFLASWGLNYQREPLGRRLGFPAGRPAPAAFTRFADETVSEVNRLRPLAMATPWPDSRALATSLAPAFRTALPGVGARPDVVPGLPKWSLLQPYLRWAGIDGVTDPFLPEVIVNHDLLPVEWPFTLAHEWGHLAGLAHEAEASYAGWRTCLAGSEQSRYSARLWAVAHVISAAPPQQKARLIAALDEGPKSDLRAIARRSQASIHVVRKMSWASYDRYLKTNRVSEGLASYDDAIALILASRPE